MTGSKCCPICNLVGLQVIIGALNWGAIGVMNVNYVEKLLGAYPTALKVVYILVGLAGLIKVIMCFKACPCGCAKGDSGGSCSTKK
jgi:uncharacterized membrane protein YuzA (DUF378 family)